MGYIKMAEFSFPKLGAVLGGILSFIKVSHETFYLN